MDLLSKGYKFLSELDDPKGESAATDLESSLDGVAEKWLGWARGGAPNSSEPEELATISGAGLLGDHPDEEDEKPAMEQDDDDAHNPFAVCQPDPDANQPFSSQSEPEAAIPVAKSNFEVEQAEMVEEAEAPEPRDSGQMPDLEMKSDMETETLDFVTESPKGIADNIASFDHKVPETPVLPDGDLGQFPVLDAAPASPPALATSPLKELTESSAQQGGLLEGTAEGTAEGPEVAAEDSAPNPFSERMEESADAVVQRLRSELADAHGLLKQRERQLSDLSNVLAEMEARDAQRREQSQATKSKAVDAVRQAERLASQWQKRAEQAETTKEEIKERAAVEVRRLKQEARDMEQELHKAQETWREKIRKAEARATELEKEGKDAANVSSTELAKMKARLRAQAAGSEETRGELEAYKARAEDEMGRLNERMRAMADSELRLRHELQSSEQSRQELQERVVELSGQLEHAQQAYSEAAREVGQMSLRLNELEFGQKADSHSEDLLREELAATRERLTALEERHKECVWMRDHALQQAEEVRMKLQAAEEQQDQLRKQMVEQGAEAVNSKTPQADALDALQQEVAALQQQMQRLIEQHETELKQQAAMSTEEIDYLKRKNDEKDKRLEILTCERNALRYESSEASKPSKVALTPSREAGDKVEKLVDLEDGFSFKELSREQGAMKAFLSDGDLVLKRFSKLLFVSPTTRRLFYGYVLLLHIWIWVVLHRAAAVHSAHTITKPVAPG